MALQPEFLWFGLGVEFRDPHRRTCAEPAFTKAEITRSAFNVLNTKIKYKTKYLKNEN